MIIFDLFREFLLLQLLNLRRLKHALFKFSASHIFLFPVFLSLFIGLYWGYWVLSEKLVGFVFTQPYYGVILATKLIQVLLLVCIGLSFVSGLTPAISSLYLSKDLEFQFALPMRLPVWMLDRFIGILLQSSGMTLLFGSPFLFHFLVYSQKGFGIFLLSFFAMVLTCCVPVILIIIASMFLVRIFPVQRLQQVFLVLSIVLLATLVLFFRYLEPEQFIGPGGMERFRGYLDLVQLDRMAWNPGIWAGNLITALSQGEWKAAAGFFAKLGGINVGLFLAMFIFGSRVYRRSWDRALFALSGESKPSKRRSSPLSRLISNSRYCQEVKETLVFFRDPSQWAQVFVLVALVLLYVFSVDKLGDSLYGIGKALFGHSPLGLAIGNSLIVAFVGLSIASRFVFTSFSMDGQALWILRTIPGGWGRYIRSKFLVYGFPVFFFGILLQIGTIVVLNIQGMERVYLLLATLWDATFLVGLSTLFGMTFLNPSIENPLRMIISPGGILLMGTGLFFSMLHTLIRYSGQSNLFNTYTSRIGFPNLQDGRELYWSIGLVTFELVLLGVFNTLAVKKLQTASS